MKTFADLFTDPTNLMILVTTLLAAYSLVTLLQGQFQDDNLSKRLKSVANRREELRKAARQSQIKEYTGIRQTDESLYKKIVDKLDLKTLLNDTKVVDKLAQAGFRGPKPISTYYFFRLAMPIILAILTAFYLFFINDFKLILQQKMLAIMALAVLGYYAPNLYIKNIADKRKLNIVQNFPDALDLMLITVEAGMSIEGALQKVSAEIGSSSIELAEELSLLLAELSYLPERRMAYEGLSRRVDYPGIKDVCTALIQCEKYGTPLGSALRVMAKENREMRMSAAEKKAAALPAQLTVPMIIFFLPCLFVVILTPVVLRIMDIQSHHVN